MCIRDRTTTAATVSNGGGQFNGTIQVGGSTDGHDVKFFGNGSGKFMQWDESADSLLISGTTLTTGAIQVGVDGTGHDVKFFGATSGAYMQWDESADDLILGGAAKMGIGTTSPIAKLHVSNAGAEGLEVNPTGGTVNLTGYNRSGGAYAPVALTGSGGGTLTMGADGAVFNTVLTTTGNILLSGSGNPSMTVKTSGAGNNPSYALRAGDNTVFDIAGIFSANPDYLRIGKGTGGSVDTDLLQVFVGGDVEVSNGNLVIGTAGKGIDFSNQTRSALTGVGNHVEILDHYEEGTFTPVYVATGTAFGAITHDTQSGYYTRIGNVVNFSLVLRTDAFTLGSGSGSVIINGLPFSAAGIDTFPVAINAQSGWTNYMPFSGWVSSTVITLTNNAGGSDRTGYRTIPVANMTDGLDKNRIYLTGTYITNA